MALADLGHDQADRAELSLLAAIFQGSGKPFLTPDTTVLRQIPCLNPRQGLRRKTDLRATSAFFILATFGTGSIRQLTALTPFAAAAPDPLSEAA